MEIMEASPTTATEIQFKEMINNHDTRFFNHLYKQYWSPLIKFTSQYMEDTDTCEEIVQDLFVHLHSMQQRLKVNTSFTAYLYISLRNRIYNHIRNRAVYKKHITRFVASITSSHNNIDHSIFYADLEKMIAQALQLMPARYREVYLLHYHNCYTVKKIALLLNRPADTVDKQLRKAVGIIRSHLLKIQIH